MKLLLKPEVDYLRCVIRMLNGQVLTFREIERSGLTIEQAMNGIKTDVNLSTILAAAISIFTHHTDVIKEAEQAGVSIVEGFLSTHRLPDDKVAELSKDLGVTSDVIVNIEDALIALIEGQLNKLTA